MAWDTSELKHLVLGAGPSFSPLLSCSRVADLVCEAHINELVQ